MISTAPSQLYDQGKGAPPFLQSMPGLDLYDKTTACSITQDAGPSNEMECSNLLSPSQLYMTTE